MVKILIKDLTNYSEAIANKIRTSNDDLSIDINSNGGDFDVALRYYNLIKAYAPNATTNILEKCASAATVVFLAGKKRTMNPTGSSVGLHSVHIRLDGIMDQSTVADYDAELTKRQNQVKEIYVSLGIDQVMIDALNTVKPTYFTATECLQYNFITNMNKTFLNSLKEKFKDFAGFLNQIDGLSTEELKAELVQEKIDVIEKVAELEQLTSSNIAEENALASEINKSEATINELEQKIALDSTVSNQENGTEITLPDGSKFYSETPIGTQVENSEYTGIINDENFMYVIENGVIVGKIMITSNYLKDMQSSENLYMNTIADLKTEVAKKDDEAKVYINSISSYEDTLSKIASNYKINSFEDIQKESITKPERKGTIVM